jgi:hypothetical protein
VYVPGRLYESGLVVVAIIVPAQASVAVGNVVIVVCNLHLLQGVARLGIDFNITNDYINFFVSSQPPVPIILQLY